MAKIGKNVLENLTSGMYKESKIIFREYIQNAADQIDRAIQEGIFQGEKLFIDIDINECKRKITIKDNATGIEKKDVERYLADVADSDKKRGVDKGFRGIGRLGGLAYCNTLRFITSAKGENIKTIMSWDAKELSNKLNDINVKEDASIILDEIISYEYENCDYNEHFFIVEMEGIKSENNELLDVSSVRKYISKNAPVPYSNKLIFKSKIYDYLINNTLNLSEYIIYVNGEDIKKPYTTSLYRKSGNHREKYDEIYDIKIEEFKRDNGEMLAWMWFGVSTFDKRIPSSVNEMVGLRLRKENIQIGDENTLVDLFKEDRGNFYFIGEVHALHKDLIPNARRDNFNENVVRNEFEAILRQYFTNFHQLYYNANNLKSAFKKGIDLKQKEANLEKKQNKFVDDKEKEKIIRDLETAKELKQKADRDIDKLREKAKSDVVFAVVLKHVEENYKKELKDKGLEKKDISKNKTDKEIETNNEKKYKKSGYIVDELSKLSNSQRKLVAKIYSIISNSLPEGESCALINTIQKELKK